MALDFDVTYFIVLALFLVPLVLLNGLVFRPFLKVFEERHEKLEGALERAEALLKDAETRAQEFEERMKRATEEGVEKRNAIRQETQNELSERLQAEKTRVAAKLEEGRAELARAQDAALAEVQARAASLAELTAEKLLGRTL